MMMMIVMMEAGFLRVGITLIVVSTNKEGMQQLHLQQALHHRCLHHLVHAWWELMRTRPIPSPAHWMYSIFSRLISWRWCAAHDMDYRLLLLLLLVMYIVYILSIALVPLSRLYKLDINAILMMMVMFICLVTSMLHPHTHLSTHPSITWLVYCRHSQTRLPRRTRWARHSCGWHPRTTAPSHGPLPGKPTPPCSLRWQPQFQISSPPLLYCVDESMERRQRVDMQVGIISRINSL